MEFDCTVNDKATQDTTHVDDYGIVKIATASGVKTNRVHNPLYLPTPVDEIIPVRKTTIIPDDKKPGIPKEFT